LWRALGDRRHRRSVARLKRDRNHPIRMMTWLRGS
jgi:hypothetical protein